MPDMERRLEEWRRAALASVGRREIVEELEAHLREEIDRLTAVGRSQEEAFAVAAARLGTPPALAAEFAKVGAAGWWPVVWVVGGLILGAAALLALLPARLWERPDGLLLAAHVISVTLGYGTTLAVGLLGILYLLTRPVRDPGPGPAFAFNRAARALTTASLFLTAAGVLLGGLWAREQMGRFWAWDPKEVGGLLVVGWGLVALVVLRGQGTNAIPAALLGLGGNVVVVLAWFGPLMLVRADLLPLLMAFVAAQLALGSLAVVPPGRLRSAG